MEVFLGNISVQIDYFSYKWRKKRYFWVKKIKIDKTRIY